MSHYQTLLIDLDHTLLDSDGSEAAAFADTLAAVGVAEAAQHLATYRHINGVLWREVERGTLSAPQVRVLRFEKLVAKLGLSADAHVMAEDYAHGLGANGDLYPGARDALEALAPAVPMALVTNGLSDIQRARINRLEIGHYFDAIIISGEIGVAKPHPRFFDHTFEKMSQPDKATTLMVGDSLSADMRGGHHYGIATCWYNADGERSAGEQRDQITHEITHLDQLPGLVLAPNTAR